MNEPKIRFKGFRGEWEKVQLNSFAKRVTRKNSHLESTLALTIASAHGLVSQIDYFNNLVVGSNISNYYLLKKGEFAYNKSYSNGYPFGSVKRLDKYEQGILSTLYITFCIDDSISSDYLTHYFDTTLWHRDVAENAAEGARNHGLLNISAEDFFKIKIVKPQSKAEQRAIASYFQHLDSLIQSTTKKIESLKQVKAASLQSMFPQEGETTPRVRFKGFEGEWEKKTLGDCLTINNERNQSNIYGINDVLSVSDEVGVVNQIKLLGRSYAGKSVVNYRVLKTNQIVYTKSPLKSKPYGIIKVNKGDIGIVSVLYAVYDANENVYPDYIHYYFEPIHRINNYLLPLINKGAKNTMNISDEMALTGNIWIPSLEEQNTIANYFTTLDRQITLQSQRLEKLKQIKAACLDKMFV